MIETIKQGLLLAVSGIMFCLAVTLLCLQLSGLEELRQTCCAQEAVVVIQNAEN